MSSAIKHLEMTKLQQLNRNCNRLHVLTNRFLRISALNDLHGYDLSDEFYMYSKKKQYERICFSIRVEKELLTVQNRRLTKGIQEESCLKAITLTKTDLYNLTAPSL